MDSATKMLIPSTDHLDLTIDSRAVAQKIGMSLEKIGVRASIFGLNPSFSLAIGQNPYYSHIFRQNKHPLPCYDLRCQGFDS